MAEILKDWLTERLQQPITWEAEEFGIKMKNGFVISRVLHSYHIINEEKHFLIRSSNAPEDIKNNWKYLSQWLREIDVTMTDTELENIMDGKSSALLRLFYKLFLHLDKKDRTNFIQRERKMVSNLVEKMGHRFTVNKIPDEEESFIDDLSRPLLNEKHFIEWQRKKAEQVKETHDYIRHKYSKSLKRIEDANAIRQYQISIPKKLSSKEQIEMDKFAQRYPCQFNNYTYEDLLALEQKAQKHKAALSDTEWAKNYMDNLYTRIDKNNDSEEFQKQLRNTLSGSLWDHSIAEEETKADTELARKVMKLSQFEKQMCTQIMETKQQARNLVRNRVQAEKEFSEQREHMFDQFLDNVKEQIHLEVEELDFEKQRQKMLHKKLYAEKMKRKRAHYYEICYETMLSIVDYATKYAYFKRLLEADDIPDHFIHEWKTLYFKKQPIFDILDPMEDILQEQRLEEEPAPEEEEIITLELDRQDALNESEFIEYHNYSYPWTLDLLIPNYDPESEDRKYEYLGTRILGHVVYTLLEIKYPFPPSPPPADLPHYTSKALLRGLPDRSITVSMQILLDSRRIHVTRLESAINYCLRNFKAEMVGSTDIDLSFDKFSSVTQNDDDKELIKNMKADDDTTYKSSEMAVQAMIGVIPGNAKQTQTPKSLPEEEIKLSRAAELGKYAYEALSFGDSLTDHLICAMLVEYLKDQEDINGFVIINYPNSYKEAQILEETFSGNAPPDEGDLQDRDDIYLEETIAKHRKKEKDIHKHVRVSKLLGNPHKKVRDKPFESYFTSYIHLKQTEDILQELVIWDLNEENSEVIDRFYAILGLNYSMYYEVMDKEFLSQICKYIIGDILPIHSLDSLFGPNVLSALEFVQTSEKRIKSKIIKPEVSDGKSKDKLRSTSKVSKSSVTEFEVVKEHVSEVYPDEILMIEEHANEEQTQVPLEEIKILAGEEDWEYGQIPIAEIIGVSLASCWEEIERVYIHDMQQLFFAIRLQMNCLVPYTRYIRDKMDQIITLPSQKQDIVCNFQMEYNNFENDWRDINLTKNEWHCRVKDLQNRLYHICDQRKMYAQQQRLALICDNWAMEELTTMVNNFISCMQAELNRSILTFQALHDFYFAMLKRLPPNDRLSSKDLMKITRESDDASGSRKGGEEKLYRQLKTAYQDMQHKNIVIDYTNNPFNMVIENNVKFAVKVVKDTNDSYRSLIAREYTEVAKIQPPPKKKDESSSSEESIAVEEIFKANALKCIEEWTMGINGEMFRAHLRMLALQYKCYKDMKLFSDHIYNTFMRIQNDINTYYINEIESVDRLCKYLQMAIENGRRVPETLILENDTFVIDPNLLQFPPDVPPVDSDEARDLVGSMDFKISQLAALKVQFKLVAPTGLALQQAFIYLLQDFIFFGKESCEGTVFPEAWLRVDPEQIPKLIFLMFGDTVYIDWRDFLIYCLNIRFPTVEELLELRTKYRCYDLESTELISREDYLDEPLWFGSDFDLDDKHAQLRKNLIKNFLFELYETEQDMMNYSAFLLAFCKNVNPIEGFATALSMAVGKKSCFCLEECEAVVCKLIKQKEYRDACLACALSCAQKFLDTVLDKVINYCEGTSIVELLYVPPVEDKKGKKSKVGIKHKKIESKMKLGTSNFRLGKTEDQNKQARSDNNINKTYICRPCEDERDTEKPPEKVVVVEEEEHVSEPKEDKSLVYTVSQTVIWNVLRICLPWHFVLVPEEQKTPYVEQVTEVLKRLEADTDNGDIYVCRFVTEINICKLLHQVKKFTALNIMDEVRKILER